MNSNLNIQAFKDWFTLIVALIATIAGVIFWVQTINEPKFKDITLSIQTNKNTINKQVLFHDAFPTSVGALAFTTQDTALEYITCDVTFQYNKFEFLR